MKVRLFPGDRRAVGHQRMIWVADAAHTAGVDTEVSWDFPILRAPHQDGKVAVKPQPMNADVIVLQRPSNQEIVELIPLIQAQGTAVVVDVDDDIASVPVQNPAYGYEHHQMILRACQRADMVTVSTPALARRYGSHGRVALLRNCVRDELLTMPRNSDGRTVGWGGWAGTHPGDLEVTHGGISDVIRNTDARFQVIGPADFVKDRLGLDEEPAATGPLTDVPNLEYERAVGMLDVGIVPLAESKFNEAKSWLKGLQYAARGVPFVASDLPEYEVLEELGAGVTIRNRGRSWRTKVTELLTNPESALTLAAEGYTVAEEWTFSKHAHEWGEAWTKAYYRRLRSRAHNTTVTNAKVAVIPAKQPQAHKPRYKLERVA